MRRFFTEPQNIKDDMIEIFEDSKHIEKVLRMKCGDTILVFDGTGMEYTAQFTSIEKNICRAKILSKEFSLSEPGIKITLYQGLPKSGKMEVIVQKAVELGVHMIVPVVMDRSVAKINTPEQGREKSKRWQKVSLEAAKQCGRGIVPKVCEPIDFKKAIDELSLKQLSVMPYEELGHQGQNGLKVLLAQNNSATDIGIIVGPEGGFSQNEVDLAAEKNINTIGLGKRILRTETVSGAIIPVIMYDRGEF